MEQESQNIDVTNIVSRISKLNKKEKLHILNILKTHQKDYSKNAYGYFFNLATIDADVLEKVRKCLALIETNRDLIWEMDKRRDDVLMYYKSLIEERLKTTIAEKHSKYINMIRIHPLKSDLSISFRRVIKIKKRVCSDENVDPDVLMKEHTKTKKYPRNSVYHRLMTCCKALKSNNIIRKETEDGDIGDAVPDIDSTEYADIYSDAVGGDSDGVVEQCDDADLKNEFNDIQSSKESDSESVDESVDNPSEVNNDNGEESEEEDTHTTTEIEATKKQEEKMIFYRRLLNMKGFEFDKTSMLKREEYIQ